MKKGLNFIFSSIGTLEDAFRMVKEAGFDGMELSLSASGYLNLNTTEEEAYAIKALADRYGVELFSVTSDLPWEYFLTSAKEETREMAKSIVRKQIDLAAWLGCDTVLVVPGAVGCDSRPGSEVIDYDVAYERALEAMKELTAFAEEKKVSIALENVANKFLLSPLEFRDFIDKVGSPYLGSYFDVGNIMRIGYPDQWIRILGHRIKKIHVKDFKRTANGYVYLLEGNVDFPAVMDALRKIGYDGWITAEMGSPNKAYPTMLLEATSLAMDKIMKN